MRSRFLLLLSCCLCLACRTSPPPAGSSDSSLAEFAQYQPGQAVLISAHRGGKDYPGYPENCLETMRFVQQRIPQVVMEVDVAQTSDGVLVLLHDDQLDRTTTGSGPVSQQSYADLQGLWLEDNAGTETRFRIPSFAAVLAWADSANVILTVDIKRSVDPVAVLDFINKQNALDHCVMITYSLNTAQALYEHDPRVILSVSMRNEEEFARALKSGIPTANMIAFTGTRRSPASLFTAIHAKGMRCIFGTLGNLDRSKAAQDGSLYQELQQEGVDIFATDRPLEVAEALGLE